MLKRWGLLLGLVLPMVAAAAEQNVELVTPTGKLAGTLQVPARAHPPVVLIVAGSGPTDRDGNSLVAGRNDSLKMLGQALEAAGYAVLRYDKRGVGASRGAAMPESLMRFDHSVQDALGWLRWLQQDGRFGPVVLLGHSEGALIVTLAAQQAKVAALISVSGSGQRAGDLLRAQLARQLSADDAARHDAFVRALEAGQEGPAPLPQLANLYRPSVQPYLISWFRYDPAAELKKLQLPVLIVQGTADLQVQPADAERLAAAQPRARLVLVPQMNHVLKHISDPAQNLPAYRDPSLPLDPALMPAVVNFLNSELGPASN
ncbi:alpha/beta hydrolase [Massilia sp. TS11]|uniref:alpha/beta hydrolase n=1 Tax=Massilia sp. TS11 TaxID=2908003 RepID=UPI001EDADEDD|nr:alpha/beta fold hydrolase [Massilia sp. TS11]MCG2583028.1 lysophospholipase [Massilia sp. TS11]